MTHMVNDCNQLRPLIATQVVRDDRPVELLTEDDGLKVSVLAVPHRQRREDGAERVSAGSMFLQVRQPNDAAPLPGRLAAAERLIEPVLDRVGAADLPPALVQLFGDERPAVLGQKEPRRPSGLRRLRPRRPAHSHRLQRHVPQRHHAGHERLAAVGVNALAFPVNVGVVKVAQVGRAHAAVEHQQDVGGAVNVGAHRGVKQIADLVGLPVRRPLLTADGLALRPLFLLGRDAECVRVERGGYEAADAAAPIEERPDLRDVLLGRVDAALQGEVAQRLEQVIGRSDLAEVGQLAVAAGEHHECGDLFAVARPLGGADSAVLQLLVQVGQEQVRRLADLQVGHADFGGAALGAARLFPVHGADGVAGRDLPEVGAVRVAGELAAPTAPGMPAQAVLTLHPLAFVVGRFGVTGGVTLCHVAGESRQFAKESQNSAQKKADPGKDVSESAPPFASRVTASNNNGLHIKRPRWQSKRNHPTRPEHRPEQCYSRCYFPAHPHATEQGGRN